MKALAIILWVMFATIVYGILHDQVTARVCVEYFTIGHAPIFNTEDPTLLAIGWGILATWWVGLAIGIILACAARAGSLPKIEVRQLIKPVLILIGCVACFALLSGICGYLASQYGLVWLTPDLAMAIPPEKHHFFIADLWAHLASYFGGTVSGVILSVRILYQRKRLSRTPLAEKAVHEAT